MTESSGPPSQGSQDPGGHPYPQPHYGYPRPPLAPRNALGIASLVLAVVALVSVVGGIVLGPIAAVIGLVAWRRVKHGEADNGPVAIAGIVLGALALIVGLAFLAIGIALWKDAGGGDYIDCMQQAQSDRTKQQHCAEQFRENVQDRLSVTLTPSVP